MQVLADLHCNATLSPLSSDSELFSVAADCRRGQGTNGGGGGEHFTLFHWLKTTIATHFLLPGTISNAYLWLIPVDMQILVFRRLAEWGEVKRVLPKIWEEEEGFGESVVIVNSAAHGISESALWPHRMQSPSNFLRPMKWKENWYLLVKVLKASP